MFALQIHSHDDVCCLDRIYYARLIKFAIGKRLLKNIAIYLLILLQVSVAASLLSTLRSSDNKVLAWLSAPKNRNCSVIYLRPQQTGRYVQMEIYSLKQFRLYGKVQDFPLPLPLTSPFKSSRVAQLKNNLRASFRVDHISIELSYIGSIKETNSV